MKYDVTYSCGHEDVVTLFGPGKAREQKIWWYENKAVCPTCYKKAMEEKEAKEKAENEAKLQASGVQLSVAVDDDSSLYVVAHGNVVGLDSKLTELGFTRQRIRPSQGVVNVSDPCNNWAAKFSSPTMIADMQSFAKTAMTALSPTETFRLDSDSIARVKKAEVAKKEIADAKLPPLEGSPKQVEWANSIREKIMTNLSVRGLDIKKAKRYCMASLWINMRAYPEFQITRELYPDGAIYTPAAQALLDADEPELP